MLITFCLFLFSVSASNHSGYLVAVEKDVKVYRSIDNKDIPTDAINATIDGKKYKFFNAKVYGKVYESDVIVTGKDSKTKLVLSNANTLMIGAYTNFTVREAGTDSKSSSFKLMYGKIRSVVKQDVGKNGKFQINTPSSVIGVRGTDFYTTYKPQNGTTTVTTLDGVVSVKNLTGKITQEVLVEAGYTSFVVDLSKVDTKKLKETLKIEELDKVAVPSKPIQSNSVILEDALKVSNIKISTVKEVDFENKIEAIKSENEAIELYKTGTPTVDSKNDLFNINLDKLIKKAREEEIGRQKDTEKGALNKLEQWIMSY